MKNLSISRYQIRVANFIRALTKKLFKLQEKLSFFEEIPKPMIQIRVVFARQNHNNGTNNRKRISHEIECSFGFGWHCIPILEYN